jgi:hypothetical protein
MDSIADTLSKGDVDVGETEDLPVPHTAPSRTESSTIVFVDPGVTDRDTLIDGITEGAPIFYLDPQEDGVRQISAILNQYRDVDALHIISHGSRGALSLGASQLSSDNLDTYADLLMEWNRSLARKADILIYGCNVARGEAGRAFIRDLADITVTEAGDSQDIGQHGIDPGNGYNLREALYVANKNAESDTITFDPALSWDTTPILLQFGELVINDTGIVTIDGDTDGDGNRDVTVDADGKSRVFNVQSGSGVNLDGLEITGGLTFGNGGGIYCICPVGSDPYRQRDLQQQRGGQWRRCLCPSWCFPFQQHRFR